MGLDLTVFHVGGRGGAGIAPRILFLFKNRPVEKTLYIFEADLGNIKDKEKDEYYINKMKNKYNVNAKVLQYCMSDHVGDGKFYLHSDRRASSLFPVEPRAKTYSFSSVPLPHTWGDHCKVDEIINVETTTFDELCKNGIDKKPDFLSMDAQGAEYSILQGSQIFLNGDLLGVTTETEFREIYQGQPLFADQDQLLRSHGFIFINFFSTQEWFLGQQVGGKFFTVGEVLYFRDYMYFVNKYESNLDILFPVLFKLAVSAKALGYLSYLCLIIDYIEQRWSDKYKEYVKLDDPVIQEVYNSYLKQSQRNRK